MLSVPLTVNQGWSGGVREAEESHPQRKGGQRRERLAVRPSANSSWPPPCHQTRSLQRQCHKFDFKSDVTTTAGTPVPRGASGSDYAGSAEASKSARPFRQLTLMCGRCLAQGPNGSMQAPTCRPRFDYSLQPILGMPPREFSSPPVQSIARPTLFTSVSICCEARG